MDTQKLTLEFMEVIALVNKTKPPRHNLTGAVQGEQFILGFLFIREGAVLPSQISNEMGISSARIAAALNNMEKKGLIQRDIDRSDRRQILVTLTPKGRALAEEKREAILGMISSILEELGEHDAKEFIRILRRINEIQIEKRPI